MVRSAVVALVMGLALAGFAPSGVWARDRIPDGFVGRWVWTVEGRPTFILDIAPDAEGATSITRPKTVTFFRDGTISGAQGEVSVQPLSVEVQGPDRLKLVRRDDGSTYAFDLVAPDAASLSLAEAAIPAMAFYRPYDQTRVLTDWGGDRPYRRETVVRDVVSNQEVAALYEADQAPRQTFGLLGPEIAAQDRARRARVRALMAQGGLASGRDYFHAAMIFQHGDSPSDYLLAHALATTALSLNEPMAGWLAAATLDRYLQSVGQSQIYGTQFQVPNEGEATQGAYDRDLLPDAARSAVGVPDLAAQEEQRQAYARERSPVATGK